MLLTTPEHLEQPLVERPLELVSDEALELSAREWRSQGKPLPGEALSQMPVVAIGPAETWPLADLYPPKKMPRAIRTQLVQADFYLVRFSCSFRPRHWENRVEWARFRAALLPNGGQPTAFDLYPLQIEQEVAHQTNVTFSPLLKFQELEVSGGEATFGFAYTEKRPVVSAYIGSGFDPSWDYCAFKEQDVQGTKWMYVLVKAPKGMVRGQALLELEADLLVGQSRLPAVLWRHRPDAAAQLTVQLWP